MSDQRIIDAILKGAIEQKDPTFHFGSLGAFSLHLGTAQALGYMEGRAASEKGVARYNERNLKELPPGRWVYWKEA